MSVPRKLSPKALVRRLSPRSFAAGFVVAALLVGGGAAFGAIPALTTGKFTACVTTSTGATRIIDYEAGKRCTSAETTVSWSKGWTYRGTWQPAFTYAVGDVAYSNGTSYLAKAPSPTSPPRPARPPGPSSPAGAPLVQPVPADRPAPATPRPCWGTRCSPRRALS